MRRCIAPLLASLLLLASPNRAAHAQFPDITGPEAGWTQSEQEIFWNLPVGSRLVPFPWFAVLEQADSQALFADPANLLRYGFDPARPGTANPGRLPIGLSRERDRTDGPWLGMTCAACHSRTLTFGNRAVTVNGAGAVLDFAAFDRDLSAALAATTNEEPRFRRFADRLQTSEADRPALKTRLDAVTARRTAETARNHVAVPPGPGRMDLRGIGANALAAAAGVPPDAAVSPDAPVRMPRLWGTPFYDRLLVDGSATNAGTGSLLRNIGQVLASYGTVDLSAPGPAYPSSVDLPGLLVAEALLRKLEPPRWPAIFPPVDPDRAARGAPVFVRACAGCHAPRPAASGLPPLVTVAAEAVGTDRAALRLLPPLPTGLLEGRSVAPPAAATFGPIAPPATMAAHVANGIAAAGRNRVPPQVPAGPAGHDAFRALPLAGIWANAPFLHNGAVPNLQQLLTPPENRATAFSLAPGDYDPEAVGLRMDTATPPLFDTTQPGNAASGHPYGTDLPDETRRDLLEYLKTM